jgi:hypothetical protein
LGEKGEKGAGALLSLPKISENFPSKNSSLRGARKFLKKICKKVARPRKTMYSRGLLMQQTTRRTKQ